ncbi:unnamed protein product [Adineta ricciae]|uniref:G domain-containing protein n=1 Tax=Adineta ricciae TaxID=249248 RepID=A0A815LW88_ADIRI|nr:unnamed protein product [Adineta ricciae]CAF1663007.1 unnamed protein product [Adineta ricciae]
MADIGDQLLAEDDEHNQTREQQDIDWIQYLRDKLVKFHSKVSSYGTNVATAKGIQKLSSEFEILVFGPARVGKSTLIREISGDETIVTSAKMNACTTSSEKYSDKFNIQWWDTPGFENWSVKTAKDFFKDCFYDRKILPKVAIFCRTANSLGSSDVVKYMFDEIQKNGILLLYVVTKWPFIPKSERKDILREAVSLLGGRSTGVLRSSSTGSFRAIECAPKKAYIVPVNSKEDEALGMRVPKQNLRTLRQILITKLDDESQGKLVQLYKDNLDFWSKLGYGAIEIIDDLGVGTAPAMLSAEENAVYTQVKNGNNPVKNVAPVLMAIIDKYFQSR